MKILSYFVLVLIVLSVVSYSQTGGLVAYYPLDGHADDHSGNGNNGTIMGGVTPTEDRHGNPNSAMLFNGTNGYIVVPHSESLVSMDNEMTVTAWIYVNEWFFGWAPIVCKSNQAFVESKYRFVISNASGLTFLYRSRYSSSGESIPTGEWAHVSAVYHNDSTSYYINGNFVSKFRNLTQSYAYDSTLVLELGRDVPYLTEYLNGKLDEVRIYNRALTADEVSQLYTGTSTNTENDNQIVNDFVLEQNYPNPFNPSTTISFTLPETDFVNLTVYGLTGNEIKVLVNETISAGKHQFNFDASGLSSGIYFYKVRTSKFNEIRKMILLQ